MPRRLEPWHQPRGRDPEADADALRARFAGVSAPAFRRLRSSSRRKTKLLVGLLSLIAVSAAAWQVSTLADRLGSWGLAFRHIAAAPNCDAARWANVAPARRGKAGYYESHDADGDGIACEASGR